MNVRDHYALMKRYFRNKCLPLVSSIDGLNIIKQITWNMNITKHKWITYCFLIWVATSHVSAAGELHVAGWFLAHHAGQDEYSESPVPKVAYVLPFCKLLHSDTGRWTVRLYAVPVLTSFFCFQAPFTDFIDWNVLPSSKLLISPCFDYAWFYISTSIISTWSNTFLKLILVLNHF